MPYPEFHISTQLEHYLSLLSPRLQTQARVSNQWAGTLVEDTCLEKVQEQLNRLQSGQVKAQQWAQQLEQLTQAKIAEGKLGFCSGAACWFHCFTRAGSFQAQQISLLEGLNPGQMLSQPTLNLTMAEGLAAWILALMKAFPRQDTPIRIQSSVSIEEDWIRPYVQLLQQQQLPVNTQWQQLSFFPSILNGPHEVEISEHLSWAEGDLNQALVLYQASHYLQDASLAKWADQIVSFSIYRRQQGLVRVDRADLCYGMAGLVLCYRKLYENSPQESFLEESFYWLKRMLDYLHEQGLDHLSDSYLTGVRGIHAVLQASCSEVFDFDLLLV